MDTEKMLEWFRGIWFHVWILHSNEFVFCCILWENRSVFLYSCSVNKSCWLNKRWQREMDKLGILDRKGLQRSSLTFLCEECHRWVVVGLSVCRTVSNLSEECLCSRYSGVSHSSEAFSESFWTNLALSRSKKSGDDNLKYTLNRISRGISS